MLGGYCGILRELQIPGGFATLLGYSYVCSGVLINGANLCALLTVEVDFSHAKTAVRSPVTIKGPLLREATSEHRALVEPFTNGASMTQSLMR